MTNNKQKEIITDNKKGDNNNNNNDFYELNPRFKKEEQVFVDNPVHLLYDYMDDGRQVRKSNPIKKPWPRQKPTEQYRYERFITEITDPSTGKFHPPRNDEGQKLELPYNKPPAGYIITNIIRNRDPRKNGKEYLTTIGTFYGHTGTGTPIFCPAQQPERWTRSLFKIERDYDSQTKSFYTINHGPSSTNVEFDLEFTQENLDALLKNTVGFNNNIPSELFPNDVPRFGSYPSFYIREEGRDRSGILVNGYKIFSIEETVRLFKTRSFNDLYQGSYYPKAIMEERRLRTIADNITNNTNNNPAATTSASSSASSGSNAAGSSNTNTSNNNNSNNYTMTPNYGTAKGVLEENIDQEGVQRYHNKNTGYIK